VLWFFAKIITWKEKNWKMEKDVALFGPDCTDAVKKRTLLSLIQYWIRINMPGFLIEKYRQSVI